MSTKVTKTAPPDNDHTELPACMSRGDLYKVVSGCTMPHFMAFSSQVMFWSALSFFIVLHINYFVVSRVTTPGQWKQWQVLLLGSPFVFLATLFLQNGESGSAFFENPLNLFINLFILGVTGGATYYFSKWGFFGVPRY